MSPDGPGNIRVFIRWHDQTVFAGEEVKCRITFKNVAPSQPSSSNSHAKPSPQHPRQPNASSPLHPSNRSKGAAGLAPPAPARSHHRSSLSLSVPSSRSRNRAGSVQWSPPPTQSTAPASEGQPTSGNGHRRSVSIVSIGSATSAGDGQRPSTAGSSKSQRPNRGHARASSLQIASRGGALANGSRSASHSHRPFNAQPSPLLNASYPPDRNSFHARPSGAATVPNTPGIGGPPASEPTSVSFSGFKFPLVQSPASETPGSPPPPNNDSLISPRSVASEFSRLPIRSRDQAVPTINESNVVPSARVLSTTSIAGTPRSSGEFYSLSNNSTETLASEYVAHQPLRTQQARPPHFRQRSGLSPQKAKLPESLMMGYAQIQGNFTLDGSLVNLGPFEQVKRKGVVGGQGGGVIGVETSKRDSGLLRGFGWSNLTSSIGELLGGGELSSIKEMRGMASSKSVPLLSTPQSILFVDLQLAPGQSKSFEYSFRLPKGLPPSHKGKAMKIAYSLVIGTQRPGGAKEQQVKSVEIPFRVLGSVNSYGEILGHDLMSPYILLRDQARVQGVDKSHLHEIHQKGKTLAPTSTMNGFLSYVDELLNRAQEGFGGGLLSPTATSNSRRPSTFEEAATAREAIDLAIIRSNITSEGQQSANRFEIARNGRKVGVVMLARPSYRLGESITMAVDFSGAEIPCYAVHAALETAEKIDAGLALRSEASIHRVTRKVYASSSDTTLFCRRSVFSPTIPVTATPEFITSGISLEWKIRLEFVVPVIEDRDHQADDDDDDVDDDGEEDDNDVSDGDGEHGSDAGGRRHHHHHHHQADQNPRGGGGGSGGQHPLLEEVSRDDRGGLVLVAVESLPCESFEVAVPLRVYGAVTTGLERLERDEALEEGLVV